jgi:curved DNA-binding protein CbpA
MSAFPDYYSLLNVPRSASQEEIRQAYKKASLRCEIVPSSFLQLLNSAHSVRTHPDRLVNATPAERKNATEKFQAIADAYYVLSDPRRRKEYDLLYSSRPSASADSNASADFFSQFASMFSDAGTSAGASPNEAPHVDPDGVFTDVFHDVRNLLIIGIYVI